MCQSRFMRTLFIGLLGGALLIAPGAQADSSDWLQVKRFKDVLSQAEQGKVQAMYEAGRQYERGRGTQRNLQRAAQWYQKAADANHASAMARLGILYVEGNGVEQDLDKAIELLTRAAEQNIPSAQYQLASMYELGVGVEQDIDRAISWYRQAFKGGYYRADDKVKQLTAQRQRGTAATRKPATQVATGGNTITSLLEGKWQRNGKPAGYLPSTISQCRQQNDAIHCITTAQERSTGRQTITYNTEAVLSNFNNRQFDITYTNNVLEVTQEDAAAATAFEDEGASDSPAAQAAPEQQNFSHHLECNLDTAQRISCTKDRLRKLQFVKR